MEEYYEIVDDFTKLLLGTIIRHVDNNKDYQCVFIRYQETGNANVINVINNLINGTLVASEQTIVFSPNNTFYRSKSSFKNNPNSEKALKIVKNWSLFKENPPLQSSILQFVVVSYFPEQVLHWQRTEQLNLLFVPIQQKFRIGRFKERRNPDRVCKERFKMWLDSLEDGHHITYVAIVSDKQSDIPKFFSCGTKPHVVTESVLMEMAFNFKPNYGGHIKAHGKLNGKKHFLVDAGSEHLGRGIKTALKDAEKIANALKLCYPEYEYTPLPGRGAFGHGQSF